MVYLDASVALAHLRAEERRPPEEFWQQSIIASRLLEYEIRTVMNLRPLVRAEDEAIRTLIGRIALLELIPATRDLRPAYGPGRKETKDPTVRRVVEGASIRRVSS